MTWQYLILLEPKIRENEFGSRHAAVRRSIAYPTNFSLVAAKLARCANVHMPVKNNTDSNNWARINKLVYMNRVGPQV